MRVFLTANISKEDFVNGMSAEIQDYDPRSQCLEVETRTGKRLAVHIVTHELEDGRRVACFPGSPRVRLHSAESAGHDLGAHHLVVGPRGVPSSCVRGFVSRAER